jgi:hypothetical protein
MTLQEKDREITRRKRMNAVTSILLEEHILISRIEWTVPLDSTNANNGLVAYIPTGDTFEFFNIYGGCVSRTSVDGLRTLATVAGTWEERLGHFRQWLQTVSQYERFINHEYESTPDLWKILTALSDESISSHIENVPFTAPEQEYIGRELRRIADTVSKEHNLTEAQFTHLNQKVDQIIESSNRIGKKDWTMVVVGSLLSILSSAILPPEAAQAFVMSFIQAMQPLIESVTALLE